MKLKQDARMYQNNNKGFIQSDRTDPFKFKMRKAAPPSSQMSDHSSGSQEGRVRVMYLETKQNIIHK